MSHLFRLGILAPAAGYDFWFLLFFCSDELVFPEAFLVVKGTLVLTALGFGVTGRHLALLFLVPMPLRC
jgi:hypothetical protein